MNQKLIILLTCCFIGTSLFSQDLKEKQDPLYVCLFCGCPGDISKTCLLDNFSINETLGNPGMGLYIKIPYGKDEKTEDSLFYSIVSFTFSMTTGGDYREIKTKGSRITSEMAKILKAARIGDKFYLEDVKIYGYRKNGENIMREVSSVAFRII